ncbi:3-hydroxybenzoate 6-hydroxylase 1 [Tepidimonas thermarum]|uniref:3-hydroxybenzoate 6-hydroxylase 1 n=2 Tax=Tepidimonas thermarum TaxID=335431 RepID=A0A554WYE6_9BURK|nr:3-hydroxybenzoate 6-hydroxylase 1 [Tepidimonas thermarum]
MMTPVQRDRILIVGGGMAGLGAALACARARPYAEVTLLERAPEFSEVGAGIQLGPNAVRVLHAWGLRDALQAVAAYPQRLRVRAVSSGAELGQLPLGEAARQRYGQPYATVHRADLHGLLLAAVQDTTGVALHTGEAVVDHTSGPDGVAVTTATGRRWDADVLLAADGVWSRIRERELGDGRPRFSGHLAYRGLVRMADLPPALRAPEVVAWLGPGLHGVHYPVRAGQWLNVVVVVEGPLPPADTESWDHEAHAVNLRAALGAVHADLEAVLHAVLRWRLWPLHVRAPMRGAHEHARGRVALLGDAAHPTRPYLAQGAAMALEDAWALGRLLAADAAPDWRACLARWAQGRWARNARVQAVSRRNGTVFHASGLVRWGRDAAMALLGARVLDQPWLYDGPPDPLVAARH